MTIVVGLGNPGPEYRDTRHNVGFRVIDELRRRAGDPPERRVRRATLCRLRLGGREVVLARPGTYMNRSGAVMPALLQSEDAGPEDVLVICDDLHLDLGALRLRPRGTHGGHNGLRSIIEALGTVEFPRLRIGVGPVPDGLTHEDFVLASFRRAERRRLESIVEMAAQCVETAVAEGVARAMNRYNGRPAVDDAVTGGPR
ncbi:MAG TPA: aminoacyl-tRNA hydrolase [Candidatus Polarisedimenticolia bacterium]|nr:aminoacyl-tRNA hydrolase [Candidatus Polarisedimenticolia bacterium]